MWCGKAALTVWHWGDRVRASGLPALNKLGKLFLGWYLHAFSKSERFVPLTMSFCRVSRTKCLPPTQAEAPGQSEGFLRCLLLGGLGLPGRRSLHLRDYPTQQEGRAQAPTLARFLGLKFTSHFIRLFFLPFFSPCGYSSCGKDGVIKHQGYQASHLHW